MLHRGLLPSHLSFLLRHIIHARRLGLGTWAFLGGCAVATLDSPFALLPTFTVTLSPTSSVPFMGVSVSELDMLSRTEPSAATVAGAVLHVWARKRIEVSGIR